MDAAEAYRVMDTRSRVWWRRPRLGVRIRWPGDGSELVYVPAGRFPMGSRSGEPETNEYEKPQHEVELSGFWIQRTPVTNGQYRRFMSATGHRPPDQADSAGVSWGAPVWSGGNFPPDRADEPVVCVSWEDAQDYCEWAGLRLPTEAEWEYAARGPEGRKYPWGDEWDGSRLCWNRSTREGVARTVPVGSFPEGVSWCGALDLAGNVWEWCADWYDREYYRHSPARDPQGPDTGEYRVSRGCSWNREKPEYFRCTLRGNNEPSSRGADRGFRCVRGL